jgi:hypothetical protein
MQLLEVSGAVQPLERSLGFKGLMVQVSLPYNKTGRVSVLCSFILPVQRVKVAILPLDFPCSGPVTLSGEILTTGKSHIKKPPFFKF